MKNKNKKHKKKNKKVKELIATSEEVAHIARLAQEKEEASKNNKPWVSILDVDVNYENLSEGNFELDWNDLFITRLMRAGYRGKEDADLVDQWFSDVCKNIVLETYEQDKADPEKRAAESADLSDGRREYK